MNPSQPMAHTTLAVGNAPTACPRSGTVSLSDGLLVAQGAISGVSKDARNTFHRYAYTSAEGMISACRDALQKGGVVARPNPGTDTQQLRAL